jgi:hypothetical protein
MNIKEDTQFRNEFIDTLSKKFAESMPVNLPVPESYEYEEDDEEFDEEVYEEYNAREFEYFEAVIQNLELATNIITQVSSKYFIIPAIPDIADDKLQFMADLEERYYFFNIPALIAGSSTTIIKRP